MRRPKALAAVLFLSAGIFAAGVVVTGGRVAVIDWYRLDEPDLVTISVTTGAHAWTRVTDVSETDTAVTITVKSFQFDVGPQSAAGYPRELPVRLGQPLGSRAVFDATGHQVPIYEPPLP